MKAKDEATKRMGIYLSIVFAVIYFPWIVALIIPSIGETVYAILNFPVVFMGTPALAVFITRKLTKDARPLPFSTKVLKNKKALLFSALVPGAAIFLGTVLFFLIFPNDLDFQGRFIAETYGVYGAPQDIELTVSAMFVMGLIVYAISAVAVPVWVFALGEDIGWQGYMLPLLCRKMNVKSAVIINGLLWGLVHAPLIYYGFNYGVDYFGAPYTGMLMMTLMAVVMGVWMSYITLRTGNCMYAAVIHGAFNVIGEAGNWISLSTKSSLLGPTPAGIIGLSVLLIGAIVLLFRMPDNAGNGIKGE